MEKQVSGLCGLPSLTLASCPLCLSELSGLMSSGREEKRRWRGRNTCEDCPVATGPVGRPCPLCVSKSASVSFPSCQESNADSHFIDEERGVRRWIRVMRLRDAQVIYWGQRSTVRFWKHRSYEVFHTRAWQGMAKERWACGHFRMGGGISEWVEV